MNNSTETPYAYDPPAWAIAGHAVHGQCRQHQGNAEGICHWQPVSTCRKCLEWLLPDRLLIHNHVLTQLNGARISDYILSLSSTSYMSVVFIWFLQHKDDKLLSIYGNIKSQDYFIERTNAWMDNWFDTTQSSWKALNYIAFILFLLKKISKGDKVKMIL